jgi:PhnB protein
MANGSHVPPKGWVLTPYVCCRNAAEAIEWYGEVFGAAPTGEPFVDGDGRIGHAEIAIDGAAIMLSDGYPEVGVVAPEPDRPATYSLSLYVPDVDATVAAAERAGATVQRPVEDQFYGARMGVIVDPFGVRWMIATHVREVPDEELATARQEYSAGD